MQNFMVATCIWAFLVRILAGTVLCFALDWSHAKKRARGNTKGRLTMESPRKQEERKT
jgi:hypothetical protein